MPIGRKYERDVDLLLAEEFRVNPAFADWFRTHTKFSNRPARVHDVSNSLANNMGESDLVVFFDADDGSRFALMIEDKVDAVLQPDQAARYRIRGDRHVECGECGDYEVLLCAPRKYLDSAHHDLTEFDRRITLEEIAAFLARDPSERSQYRAQFLEQAADTGRVNTWKREDDDVTNTFWRAAYELATREFTILEMKELTPTKDQAWLELRPRDFPTQPKRTCVSLKGPRGCVDLTFRNTVAHEFATRVKSLLSAEMTVHQTAKSAAIRIEAARFTVSDGLAAGLPKVRQAFEASARLIEFYRQHRATLDKAAGESTSA